MDIQSNKQEISPNDPVSALANAPAKRVTEATRVPMSLPSLKLAVPEMPGYFLYWHLGRNVKAAIRAGYEFVEEGEIEVEQKGIANNAAESGSTDMGTRISIAAGRGSSEEGEDPDRLYLMKLRQEWRDADQAAQAAVNENIAVSLRSGTLGAEGDPDRNKRYMKQGQDLFYPKARK